MSEMLEVCCSVSIVQFHFGRVGSVRLFGCSVGSILFFWPTDDAMICPRGYKERGGTFPPKKFLPPLSPVFSKSQIPTARMMIIDFLILVNSF